MGQTVSAVLLAAGESTRMGSLKALLDWHGQPLLAYQAAALLGAPIERLVVVLGHRGDELEMLLPADERVRVVKNLAYRTGKVSSILHGVAAIPEGHDVLVLGVDQPRSSDLLAQTISAHQSGKAAITIAGYGGRRGHPVIFSAALRGELLAISEASQGLRAVLMAHREDTHVFATGSPLALANLNTPEDYAAALRLSG